tara:strand:+ start:1 stop:1377 length:1377 start_codon:yes stop_codon:yes gene_type:complete
MIKKNFEENYFLILLSIIPISILIGSSVSLINIILISISSILFLINKKYLFVLKNKVSIFLFIIFIYLLFNSIISINPETGLSRNIGFLRFILFFFTVNYIFFNIKKINIIFFFWLLVFFVVLFDCFYEIFLGQNILGYSVSQGSLPQGRVVSFFKDELVVVSFLNGFFFLIIGFLFSNKNIKKSQSNILIILILLLFVIFIIFSGERSNSIKAFIGLFIFFILNHNIKTKNKILGAFFIILVFTVLFNQSKWIKYRYGHDLLFKILDSEKRTEFVKNNIYFNLYKSGFEVFSNNPFFGVGNKNYRNVSCELGQILDRIYVLDLIKEKQKDPQKIKIIKEEYKYLKDKSEDLKNLNYGYICNMHPHQIYIEFLAEHGLFGFILLLSILFYLIFKNLKIILMSKNMLQIGAFSYLLINFIPLLPSGSFFSDFNSTLFWLNFSILYASNKKTNIFNEFKK